MYGFCYVVGAGTGVGKTLVSAGLARALCVQNKNVEYVKPLQTGYPADCDGAVVARVSGGRARTFYAWKEAVSPHLAAANEAVNLVAENVVFEKNHEWNSDAEVIERLTLVHRHHKWQLQKDQMHLPNDNLPIVNKHTQNTVKKTWTLVEGAGGVLSPAASGTPQADLFRKCLAPVLLVGDSKLGGISATLTAFESLRLRGFEIDGVVFLGDDLKNAAAFSHALSSCTENLVVPVFSIAAIETGETLESWCVRTKAGFAKLEKTLAEVHELRAQRNSTLANRASGILWWPFTQHKSLQPSAVLAVDSGTGSAHQVISSDGTFSEALHNGSGSWWTQGLPYGDVSNVSSAAFAMARYGHLLFAGAAHAPAVALAEMVLNDLAPGWGERVFYSDNGSTAIEVALKMAFRWAQKPNAELVVVGLQGSYHGDTLGAVDCSAPDVFKQGIAWYKPRGVWLNAPCYSFENGAWRISATLNENFSSRHEIFSAQRDFSSAAKVYAENIAECFREHFPGAPETKMIPMALLIEPLVLGTGGMKFVDPLYLRVLVRLARAQGMLIIFDEVFTGCYRLGAPTAAALLGVEPDIACYGKLLTGGTHAIGVTVARESVFNLFLSENRTAALLHGHSYTAAPTACAAAVHALQYYRKKWTERQATNETQMATENGDSWSDVGVRELSACPQVVSARHLGGILAWEMQGEGGYASEVSQGCVGELKKRGVHARALGNVGYLLARPFAPPTESAFLLKILLEIMNSP